MGKHPTLWGEPPKGLYFRADESVTDSDVGPSSAVLKLGIIRLMEVRAARRQTFHMVSLRQEEKPVDSDYSLPEDQRKR